MCGDIGAVGRLVRYIVDMQTRMFSYCILLCLGEWVKRG